MDKKVIFSGIQPSGNLHIGNYIGAIKQWVELQDGENELILCMVDLHTITVAQDPQKLRQKNLELAALYIACGIDPAISHIFIQSENPDHPYLAWIFDCLIPMGWMERMTQYKDKSNKQGERTSVGLFSYPALMAADILLYDTDLVPVGEDQAQHIELTRDVAEKFNHLYGETFKSPTAMIDKQTARIMSLSNPASKMSKSDVDPNGVINMLDDADEIARKIARAVTDSGEGVSFGEQKPAISNLLTIYSRLTDETIENIEKKYLGRGYADFKNDLAEVVISVLKPIQDGYQEIFSDLSGLNKILDDGAAYAREISSKKITQVKQVVGLSRG